jgi:hypothetical protein
LAGFGLKNGYSLFFMAGQRYVHQYSISEGGDNPGEWHSLLNVNINKKLSNTITIALEQNYARHFGIGNEYRILPQIHYRLSHHFILQEGLGYEHYLGTAHPAMASRFIVEL